MHRLLIATALACASGLAQAEGAHQHGVARLEVVADGATLTITLNSPLDNLVGFERGPRSAAERSAVQAMAQKLHNGATLLQPTPAAGCTLRNVALTSDVIDPALLAKAAAPSVPGKPPAASGHADLAAVFSFDCRTPAALKGLAVGGLFQAFAKLHRLDAALAAPGVQRGARLSAKLPQLAW